MPHSLTISFVDLKFWIDNYGTISLLLGVFIGVATKVRRLIKNAARSIMLGNSFHTTFGDTPAETIKSILDSIRTSHDAIEIRAKILERVSKIGIFMCEKDGRCTFVNDYLADMFGLDSQEMINFGWLESVHYNDRQRVNDEWLYAIKNNIAYSCEYVIVNERDKTSMSVVARAASVINKKNEVQCYIGYLTVLKVLD